MKAIDRLPTARDLTVPILDVLARSEEGVDVQTLEQSVALMLRIPSKLLTIRHKASGAERRTEFQYRLAWARSYIKRAGYAINPRRNYWRILKKPESGLSGTVIARIVMQKKSVQRKVSNL
jgi:restriction system protein